MIEIPKYPHANYDPKEMVGYLAHYYPYNQVPDSHMDSWRYHSYSPNILNFKEGEEEHIKFFVKPFCALIQHSLSFLNREEAFLVPIPSSIAGNDPDFKATPRRTGDTRNRDNRNIIFCSFINIENNSLKPLDILFRKAGKKSKTKWTEEQHKESLQIKPNQGVTINHQFSGEIILLDDVVTSGNTMLGAKLFLEEVYPHAKIIRLSIGQKEEIDDFKPITNKDSGLAK